MHIGTIMMAIAVLTMFTMPLVFAGMWAQIRIKIKDEKIEKEEEKKALSLLINVELAALLNFVIGSYLKEMVSLTFTLFSVFALLLVAFALNRAMNAREIETIIQGGDTA